MADCSTEITYHGIDNSEGGAVEIVGAIVPWPMAGEREAKLRGGRAGATFRTTRERPPFFPQELQLVVSPTQIALTFLLGSKRKHVAEARAIVPPASEIGGNHRVSIEILHAYGVPGRMRNGEVRRPFSMG